MPLKNIIIERLRESQFGFKEDDKYFKEGLCPSCGQKSFYIRKDSLYKIVCNRKNKCGYMLPIRELYADLFDNLRSISPATPQNPNKTAETYLSCVRGFKNVSQFKGYFEQGSIRVKGEDYPTIRFYLAGDIYWERIIDCRDRQQNFKGRYEGMAWSIHKNSELKGDVFLTEGIFDALSLTVAGKLAVSVMSAGHIPEAYLKKLIGSGIRWHVAYDNDQAGLKGAKKITNWLTSQGEAVTVCLPEEGKDWNDHLRDGTLFKGSFFEDCRFRGRLFEAPDANSYAEILKEKYRLPLCFEYDGCYWGITQEKNDPVVSRQSNFLLKLLYTLKDDTTGDVQYRFWVTYKNNNRPREIQLSSAKLSNVQAFREGALNQAPGAIWHGQKQSLYFNLLEKFFKKPPREVRCLQQIGYDHKTGAYIFSDHAYGADGRLLFPNEYGFFSFSSRHDDNVKVIYSNRNNHFSVGEVFDWKVTNTLIDAWGWEGFCVFSWFFVSLFCEQIGQKFGWFPFLSIFGPPNTGKTTLTKWIWMTLGRDHEGIQATKKFTAKYVARQMALYSGIPTVIKEINKAVTCFSLEDLLPAFDRDPIIGRAEKSHGLETYDYPFRSALIFIQNDEPFESRPLKSRIISLHFCDKRFNLRNKTSLTASKKIRQMSIGELCGFRHAVLSRHKDFVQAIINRYTVEEDRFLKIAETSRVAQNYALLWSACNVLGQYIPRWKEIKDPCYEYLAQSIREKEKALQADNFLINRFFEVLDDLIESGLLENHAPVIKQSDEIRFAWRAFQQLAIDQRQTDLFKDVPQLQKDLQGSSRFIKYASMHSNITNKNIQLWSFLKDFSSRDSPPAGSQEEKQGG